MNKIRYYRICVFIERIQEMLFLKKSQIKNSMLYLCYKRMIACQAFRKLKKLQIELV